MIWNLNGTIGGKVLDIVDDVVEDKDEANKLKFQIQKQLLESKSTELEAQAKIVLAEAQGSWLQRNWRPLLMDTLFLHILCVKRRPVFRYNRKILGKLEKNCWVAYYAKISCYFSKKGFEMSDEIWRLGVCETVAAIREEKYTCYEVVRSAIDRLHEINPRLNAVSVDLSEEALEQASEADSKLQDNGDIGPLFGVPITLKENIDLKGKATTLGVERFANNIAPEDAPVVDSLKKAGAIIIGQTNMPEFGLRWFTDNPMRGRTNNPWDTNRTPGGSSGGAAVAVAMGIGSMAHGNDIGGSLRYPSYCCGLVTIKPGFGAVPNYNPSMGVKRPISFQIMAVQGPITRCVADTRLAFEVMSKASVLDPWSVPSIKPEGINTDKIKIGVPVILGNSVAPSVASSIEKTASMLSNRGYMVESVELPSVDELVELWGTILFNDIRIFQLDMIRESGSEDIVSIIESKLSYFPDPSLEDYAMALARRVEAIQEWAIIMEEFPVILAPVSLQPPLGHAEDIGGSDQYKKMEELQCWLIATNFLGLPSVALPTGIIDRLPTGVQLIGRRFHEDQCLDVAQAIEDEVGILVKNLWSK